MLCCGAQADWWCLLDGAFILEFLVQIYNIKRRLSRGKGKIFNIFIPPLQFISVSGANESNEPNEPNEPNAPNAPNGVHEVHETHAEKKPIGSNGF